MELHTDPYALMAADVRELYLSDRFPVRTASSAILGV